MLVVERWIVGQDDNAALAESPIGDGLFVDGLDADTQFLQQRGHDLGGFPGEFAVPLLPRGNSSRHDYDHRDVMGRAHGRTLTIVDDAPIAQ